MKVRLTVSGEEIDFLKVAVLKEMIDWMRFRNALEAKKVNRGSLEIPKERIRLGQRLYRRLQRAGKRMEKKVEEKLREKGG